MKRIFNLRKDSEDKRDFKLAVSENILRVPRKVDWSSQMSPVKDQGEWGSCVAFAVAAIKEWQEQREHNREVKEGKKDNRKKEYYDFSEAWIYSKCKEIDPWPGEEGTDIRSAMKVLKKIGVPCEAAYPYEDMFMKEPKPWAKLIAKWALIDSYYKCDTLDEIKYSLANNGPVVIGIECFEEIEWVGKNGYVPYPLNTNYSIGGHAICVVGYTENSKMLKFKNSWGCYDDKTEVLTDNGFKQFKDLEEDDLIATLNDNKIEYNKPLNYFMYEYNGEMYRYNSSKIDLMVTPNHNMYVQSLYDRQNKKNNFRFIKAENIEYKQIVFKRDGEWEGEDKDFFELPSVYQKVNENSEVIIDNKKIRMDDWLEFFGYWISEGSIYKGKCKKGGSQYFIKVSQTKVENVKIIRSCFDRLGFNYSYNGRDFTISNFQLYDYLFQFGKCNEKFIPKEIKDISKRQLKILYDALMLGDGSICEGENGSKKINYYTSSEKLRDDFQEICLKIGLCSSYSVDDRLGKYNTQGYNYNYLSYRININNTQNFNSSMPIIFEKHIRKEKYNGNVYCVEIPNHVLFIRRNGKTCWCGNSEWGKKGYGFLSYKYIRDFMWDGWAAKDLSVTRKILKERAKDEL